MEKRIWLQDSNYNWTEFNYEKLTELSAEFDSRKIKIIRYNSRIGDNSIIRYNSRIGDNLSIKSICISGTRHFVSYWGQDAIQIGCKNHTISEWKTIYESVDESEDYSADEIKEYAGYIEMISELHEKKLYEPVQREPIKEKVKP